jgi:hypothetical protein
MEANQETVRITMDRVFEESGLGTEKQGYCQMTLLLNRLIIFVLSSIL